MPGRRKWIYWRRRCAISGSFCGGGRTGGTRGSICEDFPQREGETAYAKRQAAVQAALATEFAAKWEGLADKIRRAKAREAVGEDGKGEGEAEEMDDAGEDSGEEEQPITLLSHRTVKPTYVDEVLVM
jgi:hypothetical protein